MRYRVSVDTPRHTGYARNVARSLIVSEIARECEGCTRDVGPGMIAITDEVVGDKLVAQCVRCLSSLDPLLAAAWQAIPEHAEMPALEQLPPVTYE